MEQPNDEHIGFSDVRHYDLTSPLWKDYFQRTRKNVRFPRNYKEISALDPDCSTC